MSDPVRKEFSAVVDHHANRGVDEIIVCLVQRDQVLCILWTDVSDHATHADGDCKCGWCVCRDVVVSLCHVFAFLVSELFVRSARRPRLVRRVGQELMPTSFEVF